MTTHYVSWKFDWPVELTNVYIIIWNFTIFNWPFESIDLDWLFESSVDPRMIFRTYKFRLTLEWYFELTNFDWLTVSLLSYKFIFIDCYFEVINFDWPSSAILKLQITIDPRMLFWSYKFRLTFECYFEVTNPRMPFWSCEFRLTL